MTAPIDPETGCGVQGFRYSSFLARAKAARKSMFRNA